MRYRRRSTLSVLRTLSREAARNARMYERAQKQRIRDQEKAQRAALREQKALNREAARVYAAARAHEVATMNDELEQRIRAITTLLERALPVQWGALFEEKAFPPFSEGTFDAKAWEADPPPPVQEPARAHTVVRALVSLLSACSAAFVALIIVVGFSVAVSPHITMSETVFALVGPLIAGIGAGFLVWRGYELRYQEKRLQSEALKKKHQEYEEHCHKRDDAFKQFCEREEERRCQHEEEQTGVRQTMQAVHAGTAKRDDVIGYYDGLMSSSLHEDIDAKDVKVGYSETSRQLVVELELPSLDETIPQDRSFRYIKMHDEIRATKRKPTEIKALYGSLLSQIVLKCLHVIFSVAADAVETVSLNAVLPTVDRATGQNIRPCLVSLRVTRDMFSGVNLEAVDPQLCLKGLNAAVSRSPEEVAPVRPVVEFEMVDPRFVQSEDVLSSLDDRPDLLELTPNEFENLITNLFEKMGLETKQTQASRDGGVDCVAYDARPIFGGKVVIQAKRYRNTVGVSAVRDLFGTVQNEGASKGILVTTSGYGKAAYEFASGKPLELLDGGNLLHLLKEHAGMEAKIIIPSS